MVISLMQQETSSGAKEVEIMGKRFVVHPEVFNAAMLHPILKYVTHAPLKTIAKS